jgi:hypothetical protein
MKKIFFPEPLRKILSHWHQDGIREEDCKACSSACCSHSGFAILENVTLIYEKYKRGELIRTDYEFPQGLTFTDFIWKYFDVNNFSTGRWPFKKSILLYHMRSFTSDNEIISIPTGSFYWEIRASLFNRNPWLNKGCVFLNKKVPNWPQDDKDASRICILHTPDCNEMVTEKPIDCIFFTCSQPMKCKAPTQKVSEQWMRALAVSFPDSASRFHAMIDRDSAKKTAS